MDSSNYESISYSSLWNVDEQFHPSSSLIYQNALTSDGQKEHFSYLVAPFSIPIAILQEKFNLGNVLNWKINWKTFSLFQWHVFTQFSYAIKHEPEWKAKSECSIMKSYYFVSIAIFSQRSFA